MEPTHQQIAEEAYRLWQEADQDDGLEVPDQDFFWFKALNILQHGERE